MIKKLFGELIPLAHGTGRIVVYSNHPTILNAPAWYFVVVEKIERQKSPHVVLVKPGVETPSARRSHPRRGHQLRSRKKQELIRYSKQISPFLVLLQHR